MAQRTGCKTQHSTRSATSQLNLTWCANHNLVASGACILVEGSLKLLLEKHGWEIIKSKNMFQDTIFNIYMSLSGNFAKRIVLFSFLIIYSFICQIFFVNLKSTNLVICQKK